jgi:hypothetical protein
MSLEAVMVLATVVLLAVGVVTMHLVIGLLALLPAVVTVAGLLVASRREGPFPTETLEGIAHREGRQCTTAIHSWAGGYPDRCACPQDHWGECEA